MIQVKSNTIHAVHVDSSIIHAMQVESDTIHVPQVGSSTVHGAGVMMFSLVALQAAVIRRGKCQHDLILGVCICLGSLICIYIYLEGVFVGLYYFKGPDMEPIFILASIYII